MIGLSFCSLSAVHELISHWYSTGFDKPNVRSVKERSYSRCRVVTCVTFLILILVPQQFEFSTLCQHFKDRLVHSLVSANYCLSFLRVR